MNTHIEELWRRALRDSTWHFKLERMSKDSVSIDSAYAPPISALVY